ncbi:SusC/RagA family TonB-linked outer membrane protein [Flavobacterium suncheonense]|uniref:SusC/RagA family TonB-linked outer membrane protein n=1 Tax=Flavobacterium suncheonense TaxID=350894 RepID=UPI000400DC9D|nr:SusC/RagA family TonB-linked outer membrane protein [Flavobacterium suncheonense]
MRSKFKWIFALLMAFSMQFSFAQEKTITGTVTEAGLPLPGVSVVVKGTTRGTQTDMDGNYTIAAKTGESLVFSFIGMKDQTIVVGAASKINVAMAAEATAIEDVVVTALGIKRKTDAVTSTYQKVNAEELNKAANPNAVQALVGKVSGLQINTTSSGINAENRVVLRGARSMTGNNQALVVIDGAISNIGTFQQLAPEIIESVNVLKGAQGAALYGSDGVNGVIIVTTKKGSTEGKFKVNVTSSVDISDIAYLPQRQLRYGQGWDGLHASQENGSWGPEFDGSLVPVGLPQADGSYIMAPYSPIEDNYKQFFKKGTIVQTGVTLSGGNLENGYAIFSANRNQTDFIVDKDELKRNSFLLKAGKKSGRFTVEGNINYINESVKNTVSGLYGNLLQTASNVPVSQFSGGQNQHHWTVYYNSPYWRRDNEREFGKTNRMAAIVSLGYEINKNISLSYLANLRLNTFDNWSYKNEYVDNIASVYGSRSNSVTSEYYSSTQLDRNFYGDFIVNFDYMLTNDLSFKANVGFNTQDFYTKVNQVGGTNLNIPGLYNYTNVLNPALASNLANTIITRNKFGLFGNVDLGYKEYLFLNVTGRNDWSSVFEKRNSSFFYPSAGISFIPTKAFDGLKGDILNYAKLSANWTRVGNESAVPAYAINSLGVLGIGYPFGGANSYVQQQGQTFKGITPEFVTSKEVAANFGFFNDRLTLDASYYVTDTHDLITNTGASAAAGLTTLRRNVGEMQTKGYEIDLSFTPIKMANNGLRWDNKLSYTHYKSVINKVSDEATEVSLRQPYDFVGIYAVAGEEYPLIKGTTYSRDEFGRIILDANGNPTIDPTMKKLGKVNPDYILGLTSSLSYKGVKLSATMDYRTGHQFYSDVKRNLSWTGQLVESAENRSGFIMPNSSYDYNGNGLYEANEANTNVMTGGGSMASFINYYNSYYSTTGENLVIDATAFKVRELSLSYSFNQDLIKRAGLTAVTIGVNARNPFTWFPKENRYYNDPEGSETTGNAGGLSFTDRYPVQKTYGFAVNLTF